MLVGEGPGREEDLTGRPFVGRAGRLLDELLASVGLRRGDLYITNVIKDRATVRPRADGPRPSSARDRPPSALELAACAPWLSAQIDLVRPRIIVTLGRVALAAFLPGARIGDVHGRPQTCAGLTILPLYHPAYALHSPAVRPALFRDIRVLARYAGPAHGAARS
jgi:DNA polymerase